MSCRWHVCSAVLKARLPLSTWCRGRKALSVDQLSGTRKLASLEGASAHLYRKYKLYFSGLAVRMLQSERGIGSQTKQSLTQVGRRLSSGTFVVFMLCFEDLLWLGQGQEI